MTYDKVDAEIANMGYVKCSPVIVNPCRYRINDGTKSLLNIYTYINFLLPNPQNPANFTLNTDVRMIVLTPEEHRKMGTPTQHDPASLKSGIVDHDVEFDTIYEGFDIYDLGNGMRIKSKTVLLSVKKTKFFAYTGEPIYLVDSTLMVNRSDKK